MKLKVDLCGKEVDFQFVESLFMLLLVFRFHRASKKRLLPLSLHALVEE
jgi:hypothetical protein